MPLSRGCRIALILIILLHMIGLSFVLSRQVDFLFNDASHRIGPATDFRAMHTAGLAWRSGDPVYGQGPGFGYRYHPFAAMSLFALLSLLPLEIAYFVWIVISEALLCVVLWGFRSLASSYRQFVWWVFGILVAAPLYLELYMGNATLIAVSLLLLAYFQIGKKRLRLALALYLISCLVKPLGIVLLPVILFKWGWKPALTATSVLVFLAVPYLLHDPTNSAQMFVTNCSSSTAAQGFLIHAGNQGFHAFLTRAACALSDVKLTSLQSLDQLPRTLGTILRLWPWMIFVPAIFLAWRYRAVSDLSLLFGIFMMVFVLSYKEIWEHSYVAMILVAPLLWASNNVNRKGILAGFLLIALPTAFAMYDLHYSGTRLRDPDWEWTVTISLLHHATKPAGTLVLLAFAVVGVIRTGRKTEQQLSRVTETPTVAPAAMSGSRQG